MVRSRMDLSFILIIGLSAILASIFMIYAEFVSRRVSIFRIPFVIAYLFGLVLVQPWRIESAQEAGVSVMMLVFLAFWVAVGWIIGAVPTALTLSVVRRASGTHKKLD